MSDESPRLVPSLFDGARLRQARMYRGLRKTQVADMVHITPAAVGQYEQGRTRPSAATLAALSLALGFPPPFFERDRVVEHVEESQAYFRRLRSTTKLDRDRMLARLELLTEFLGRVEEHARLPAVALPDDLALDENEDTDSAIERRAEQLRDRWGLGRGPLDNVVRLLEQHGVLVVRPMLESADVDAFSTWSSDRPIVVLSHDKGDAARSRFDAAHELGHLILHTDHEPGTRAIEQQANRFAAAFLLPAESILRELPPRMSWAAYFDLKQRWRVSLAALLYRARSLGRLSSDAYQRAQIYLSRQGWREREPIDLGLPEQPILLEKALELLRTKLNIDRAHLAGASHLPEDVVASLIADAIPEVETRPVVPF